MFIPGCGCCGCKPCPYCSPQCVSLSFEGFGHGTDICNECTFFDDLTFLLKRPDGCPTVALSAADATGSGAALTYTVEKQEDGSCKVTSLDIAKQCISGSTKSSDEPPTAEELSDAKWPCGDGENGRLRETYADNSKCTKVGDFLTGSNYSSPSLSSFVPSFINSGVQCRPATAKFTIDTIAPTGNYNLTGTAGTGAAIAVTAYTEGTWTDDNPSWSVKTLGKASAGTGYVEGTTVTLSPQKNTVTTLSAATVTIDEVNRSSPSISVVARNSINFPYLGTANVQPFTDDDGRTSYRIASVSPSPQGQVCGFTNLQALIPTTSNGSPITFLDQPEVTVVLDANQCATGFAVVNPGSFFVTTGTPTKVTLAAAGAYRTQGAITAVELIDGGEYWPGDTCNYAGCAVCATCPESFTPIRHPNGTQIYATFSVGNETNTVNVVERQWFTGGAWPPYGDTVILSATQSITDEDGNKQDCDEFTFKAESVTTGCMTNGTITVAAGDCAGQSERYCKDAMPDQITLSLSGMGLLFLWAARSGGAPDSPPTPMGTECGVQYDILIRGVGQAVGIFGYGGALVIQDCDVVLDRQETGDCFWSWSGYAPASPTEGQFGGSPQVDCGGALDVPISVSIGPTGLETTVYISPPTRGGEQAAAEVTAIGNGGTIGEVVVISPGSGYAAEIILHQEPTVTASVTGGAGAELSVALQVDNGTDRTRTWRVDSVSVVDGGEEYTDFTFVTFEIGEDDSGGGAYAYIEITRTEPTVTAEPPSGGSGGELSVTLDEGTGWSGKPVWSVDGITVDAAGTGYTDGEQVIFTLGQDDVDEFDDVASATIRTARSAPTLTAAASSGSGASLSVNITSNGGSPATWGVGSITINNGGSGYDDYELLSIGKSSGDTLVGDANIYIRVDQYGTITGTESYGGGAYFHDDGTIASVEVQSGGAYYHAKGPIESVEVEFGGAYWQDDHTGQVESDTPAVFFGSRIGSGATATATIDTDLESETFGQVTGIEITNAGQDYKLSGTGWLLSVSIGTLNHLDVLLGVELPPEPNANDPLDCNNFWDQNKPIANRVSLEPCPSDLLSRSYTMSCGAFSLPFGDPYGDGIAGATWCRNNPQFYFQAGSALFYDFGGGAITVSLAGGGGEGEE